MLGDLLADIVAGFVDGPATDRGILILWSAGGVAAASVHLWLRAAVGNAVLGPEWAWSLFTVAVVVALAGIVVGTFAFVRHGSHRKLAAICIAINAVASVLPLVLGRAV